MEGSSRLTLVQVFSSPSGVTISTVFILSLCGWVFFANWSPNLDQVAISKAESLAYQLYHSQASTKKVSRSVASDDQGLQGSLGKDPWGNPFQYVVHRTNDQLKVRVWSKTRPDLVRQIDFELKNAQ